MIREAWPQHRDPRRGGCDIGGKVIAERLHEVAPKFEVLADTVRSIILLVKTFVEFELRYDGFSKKKYKPRICEYVPPQS